jgi:hypothetical protein
VFYTYSTPLPLVLPFTKQLNICIKMDVCMYVCLCVCVCVCVCVCMFGHNSGTPGAISIKLGTHMAVCMCKNLMYFIS